MKHIYLCLALIIAAAILAAAANVGIGAKPNPAIERGAYVTNRVAQCPHCHTPRFINTDLNRRRWLAGAPILMKPLVPVATWSSAAPNLTPCGPIRRWSDTQVVRFLTIGKDPAGREANPPMPPYRLNKADAEAVKQYLRSLRAVKGS